MNQRTLRSGNALMVTGIFLIIIGILALFSPAATGGAVVKVTAVVLLVTGLLRLVQAFRSQNKIDIIMSAILGVVIGGLGILVWMNPELGSGFLTVLFTVFFVTHGVWKISAAFQYRQFPAWGWLLLSGVVSLVFAWLMLKQWPLSGAWAIGLLVGIDLVMTGAVSIMLALAIKRARASGSLETISL